MATIDPLWIAFTCHDYSTIQAWNNMNISNNDLKLGFAAESKLLVASKSPLNNITVIRTHILGIKTMLKKFNVDGLLSL